MPSPSPRPRPRKTRKTQKPGKPKARKPGPKGKLKTSGNRNPLVRPGVKTPPEIEAQVWVLHEEGWSWRQISDQIGIEIKTVGRILHSDPERLGALIRAQREERERLWRSIENRSLRALDQLIARAESSLLTPPPPPEGSRRKKAPKPLSEPEKEILTLGRHWAGLLRLTAEGATRQSIALRDRVVRDETPATPEAEALSEMDDEALVDAALELDMVDRLPARLQAIARARAGKVREQESAQNAGKTRGGSEG